MRRAVLLMALPLLMAPSAVTAQERPLRLGPSQRVRPVPEGDTVRVWASDFGLKKTKVTVLGYMFGGMLPGAGVGAGIGASYPPDRWVRVDLPVQAGFPPYRTPFHETFAFKLLYSGLGIALLAIIN